MKNKLLIQLFIFLIFTLIASEYLNGQTILDHKIFIEELKHSSDNFYNECIKKYDAYLKKFPNDVYVHIEKCKFIQNAQYDENDEYNPNQEQFDSCLTVLTNLFPNHPDVLIFQTECLWGDDLKEAFEKAENSIREYPKDWTETNRAKLYFKMANHYYYDSEYQSAYTFIQKAILADEQYKSNLINARILIKLDKQNEALDALTAEKDTTKDTWQLNQKADLLLELKAYSKALDIYNKISETDSTYNRNYELASTLEGIGEYNLARNYLIADTSKRWDKEAARRNLFLHDLKYEEGGKCIESYNKYRDLGYAKDPFSLYRLKLFFLHPCQAWKFRDFLSLLVLIAVFFILIIIPSIWILPVYFIGHHWKMITREKLYESKWGLKMFWFVSVGYLIASFLSVVAEPEYLHSLINSSFRNAELSTEQTGLMSLMFIIIFAVFAFASLYKTNLKILLSNNWSIGKSILLGTGLLFAYKVVIGIYIRIGVANFGIKVDDLTYIPNFLLAARQDLRAIIATYGKGLGFILLCLLAPLYEEIVFRGVILDSCQRYINFNVANIFQAILFATIHMNLFLFPVFLLFGIIAGIMRKKSDGLLPGIVFHIVNNTLAISVLLIK
jgi:uncharacterized protein